MGRAYCGIALRLGDKAGAQRALEGLQSKAELDDQQRLLALGQAHQLLGQYALAEEKHLKAVELFPRDATLQERLAQFYLGYSPEKAEQAFRRLA